MRTTNAIVAGAAAGLIARNVFGASDKNAFLWAIGVGIVAYTEDVDW